MRPQRRRAGPMVASRSRIPLSDRFEQVSRKREARDSDLRKFRDSRWRYIEAGHRQPQASGLAMKRLDIQPPVPPQLSHRLVQLLGLYLHLDDQEQAGAVVKQEINRTPSPDIDETATSLPRRIRPGSSKSGFAPR